MSRNKADVTPSDAPVNQSFEIPETLWPVTFAGNSNSNESPIPSIWVIAPQNRGKTNFAASVPGKMKVMDTEGSWSTLQHQRENTDVVNIRKIAAAATSAKSPNILSNLFAAFVGELEKIKPGDFDVMVIDTTGDLLFGGFFYAGLHPEFFGKTAARYNGKEGITAQWADASAWWKDQLTGNWAHMFKTVVLLSHPKNLYEKESGRKIGVGARGVDLTEAVSLKLWLYDERDHDPRGRQPGTPGFEAARWAFVEKQRLTWRFMPEGGIFPRVLPILPRQLVLPAKPAGMTFTELIWGYMSQPQPDYGDLNDVTIDPAAITNAADLAGSAMELADKKLEIMRLESAETLRAAKLAMVARLTNPYADPEGDLSPVAYYKSSTEIALAIQELGIANDAQDANKMDDVEAMLIRRAQGEILEV